jgi:hypothetical protein
MSSLHVVLEQLERPENRTRTRHVRRRSRSCATAATKSLTSIGLPWYPSNPAAMIFCRSLAHHGRRHGHDENRPRCFLGSEPSERLFPVNPGKPNVHQDQARVSLLGEADAGFSRLGFDGGVALEGQHVPDELPVLVAVRLLQVSSPNGEGCRVQVHSPLFSRPTTTPAVRRPAPGPRRGSSKEGEATGRHPLGREQLRHEGLAGGSAKLRQP